MATATKVQYCAHCANHNHPQCAGGSCECGERDHRPTVEVAAAMRRYQRFDLRSLTDEQLASQWHRKEER